MRRRISDARRNCGVRVMVRTTRIREEPDLDRRRETAERLVL